MTINEQKLDMCDIYCYDEKKENRVKQRVEQFETQTISQIFKALADDARLKIVFCLCEEGELCVCDVANIIGCSMATASHHLRLLRNMKLANYRKEGKLVFYSLQDEHLKQLIKLAFQQKEEVEV
ncbi:MULTISPECIES: metalloregulator ArsR/SmtB family transcription factor [Paenibacillus]|uniref:Helix-turn-helix transcriptional regulator n=1 Tax=Paenibacillus tianjinensis TaxID=2810347 RepID=A0ABX7LHB1_9BACL|nr:MULTISPECIES: metalloregulator ArsR/SmtB family transcription factor [Paenibacillus]MDF9839633.1 DNA-binding transcriptional ArsR family regulator [Paenibacillus sp. PastF-2]MDF9846214.1 DNA-binding transcriptional ArsR family regulator [Paenibacillus sp. PastM-2]MDF9852786.1 DNA-binding transcriptional ArsR family regulator [Paenibacillus sp. PastF-1]MDH6477484.1 DNA-binding transcriptional ArsR family regulator [Paenibacillus sp. PastH-2]QSF47484.1 helix-turn-helix transcriptional regulat